MTLGSGKPHTNGSGYHNAYAERKTLLIDQGVEDISARDTAELDGSTVTYLAANLIRSY